MVIPCYNYTQIRFDKSFKFGLYDNDDNDDANKNMFLQISRTPLAKYKLLTAVTWGRVRFVVWKRTPRNFSRTARKSYLTWTKHRKLLSQIRIDTTLSSKIRIKSNHRTAFFMFLLIKNSYTWDWQERAEKHGAKTPLNYASRLHSFVKNFMTTH